MIRTRLLPARIKHLDVIPEPNEKPWIELNKNYIQTYLVKRMITILFYTCLHQMRLTVTGLKDNTKNDGEETLVARNQRTSPPNQRNNSEFRAVGRWFEAQERFRAVHVVRSAIGPKKKT